MRDESKSVPETTGTTMDFEILLDEASRALYAAGLDQRESTRSSSSSSTGDTHLQTPDVWEDVLKTIRM